MKHLQARELSKSEKHELEQALRSSSGFTVRRAQILLSSAEQGKTPQQIAEALHCSDQCVRETVHAFHAEGLNCLTMKSRRPHQSAAKFNERGRLRLYEILHTPPRHFGYLGELWTLAGLAQVAFSEGLTTEMVSIETIRRELARLKMSWKRAKHWLISPDIHYEHKKTTGATDALGRTG